MARRYTLDIQGRTFTIDVEETDVDRFEVGVGGETFVVRLAGDEDLPEARITPAFEPGRSVHAASGTTAGGPAGAAKPAPGRVSAVAPPPPPPRRAPGRSTGGSATLSAPMPGVILEVMVKAGDKVARGQELAVLEAMKMQNMIRAPREATIAEVCVSAGNAVGHGDAIVRFVEG